MPTKRDTWLLFFLFGLTVMSSGTTLLGAKQILPSPLAEVTGLTAQALLFAMLSGLILNHAPVRKWFAVAVLSIISVYTSFFTYHENLTGEAESGAQMEIALQSHAVLVGDLYQPHRLACDTLTGEAEALYDAAEREAGGGIHSGVKGYGPVARELGRRASDKQLEAEAACAVADRLQPLFEIDTLGVTPEELFKADLGAWQQAPAPKGDAPDRADYVDLDAQIALTLPLHRVSEGDVPSVLALALALGVDGMALLLGTAVVVPLRRRRRWANA